MRRKFNSCQRWSQKFWESTISKHCVKSKGLFCSFSILASLPKCKTTLQISRRSLKTFLSIWILIVILWDLKLKATLVNVYQAVVKTDCWHPATSCILSPIYCCVDLRVTAESRRSVMTALYVLEITILLCVKKYIELLYWLLYYFLFMKRNAMYYYKK